MTGSSLTALADAVRAAAADRGRRAQLDAQLDVAERIVAEHRVERDARQRALRGELDDLRRLEKVSPTRLWATIRGDAEERLAIERAEADAAARAATAAQTRLDLAVAEAEHVRRARDDLGDVEASYRRALDAYEASLRASPAPQAVELSHILEHLGRASAEQREIDEARQALRIARNALEVALDRLRAAGGWATYDTFFGGGMIADLVKHDRIDAATSAFVAVNRALEHLAVELADIDAPAVRGVEISQTLAVFDVLFDNVIADWMVRDRIAQAQDAAVDLASRLEHLNDYLTRRAADTTGVIATLSGRREAILTSD